jgi:TonB family protein
MTGSSCKPEVGDVSKLADDLLSATVTGRDQVQFAGELTECELVRAEYSGPVIAGSNPAPARFIRTLCIDPVQKLILRDRIERCNASDRLLVETTTYLSYQRDTSLPADLFEFRVPTGYFEDDGPQPDLVVENGVYRRSMLISAPTLIFKIEPVSTVEALQARVSGIVLVSFQVDSNGDPDHVKVVRGLGHGLDEKATEAVRQWHFRPGTKDGVPVTVGPLKVAVNFPRP